MRLLITISASLLIFAVPALAETTITRACPFSCDSLGIIKSHCKDSMKKNKKGKERCSVTIMDGASGSGKAVVKKNCPLSCKSMGVKSNCQDSMEEDKCVVKF